VSLSWGTFLGAFGTAIGTLGLAFYSWRATRASQTLELTALDTLRATEQQADAARDAAQQAERARIDALAPIIDLQISPHDEWYRLVGEPPNVKNHLRTQAGAGWTYHEVVSDIFASGTLGLTLDFTVKNFGKTTAFVDFRSGPFLPSPRDLLRVEPNQTETVSGSHLFATNDQRPDEPWTFRVDAEIHGPLTEATTDRLRWEGEITMLTRAAGVNWEITKPSVLRMTGFEIRRSYPGRESAFPDNTT
jgi:hypothetical protein